MVTMLKIVKYGIKCLWPPSHRSSLRAEWVLIVFQFCSVLSGDSVLPWSVPWHWRWREKGSGWIQKGTDLGDRLIYIFFTYRQVRNEKVFMTVSFAKLSLQVRTWNFPAFVMYFMPLKGLYFSPYISRRFTLSPGRKEEYDISIIQKKQVA